MDNWDQDLQNWLNEIQKNIDDFYQNFDQEVNQTLDDFGMGIAKIAEECEEYIDEITVEVNDILEETETFVNELVNFLFNDQSDFNPDDYYQSPPTNMPDWEEWFVDENIPAKPNPQKYPACVGCRNYHGHSYGGNFLVCGIHPYGYESDKCPDWEGESD